MAAAARDLGHDYMVLTDHSPRLTIARGLSPERLREQLDVVAALNEELAPFRILTGIECDILEDGSLDQEPELLAQLDLVVAACTPSCGCRGGDDRAHGGGDQQPAHRRARPLHRPPGARARRGGKGRPESEFDAEIVFAACAQFDVAVEVNSRPERLDPPKRLLRLAVEAGCRVAIDTDAHAPGQLSWQHLGCERAHLTGVTADRVVNTWSADELLTWTKRAG